MRRDETRRRVVSTRGKRGSIAPSMVKVYVDSASSHQASRRVASSLTYALCYGSYVYERPTAIERPRTIPHTGRWGHITLPTYIQSLLIYIYYSLGPLFIVFHGDARRAENGNVNLHKLKIMERDRRRESSAARSVFARELSTRRKLVASRRFAISSTSR